MQFFYWKLNSHQRVIFFICSVSHSCISPLTYLPYGPTHTHRGMHTKHKMFLKIINIQIKMYRYRRWGSPGKRSTLGHLTVALE